MPRSILEHIISRDKGLCHYCGRKTNRRQGSALQATRDHVVPHSMGGPNTKGNFVLACQRCNNDRGTQLFYCRCESCTAKIDAALSNDYFVRDLFDDMIEFNKPRVKRMHNGEWTARAGTAVHVVAIL